MTNAIANRRRFLGFAAGGAALAAFDVWGAAIAHGARNSHAPEPSAAFKPDVELDLTAAATTAQLLPGAPTRLWQFKGRVIKGDPTAFTTLPGSTLPVIRVRNGQKIRIYFHNELPEESIVHWHGLHIVQKMDGHPAYAIRPGQQFVYEFVVDNRAATYWFHPHPHGRTGIQVYRGLAGLFIVEDDEEARAGLPGGEFELAWVLQDRRFDANNQLVYLGNHMEAMTGFTGNRMLINGQPDFVQPVAASAYRVRLLNGSNARFYKLAWADGRPLTVVGTDGGLLERPVERPYVMLAPAERVELWLDFSAGKQGEERILRSLPFSAGMMGMGMGMGMGMQAGALPNGAALDVLRVRIDRAGPAPRPLPAKLSTISWPRIEAAANARTPRVIRLEMGRGQVTLNGRVFDMENVAADEIVRLGATEVWEFANAGPMPMAHPLHVHNLQFKVIERMHDSRFAAVYATMRAGLVDEGWKDVVIVMPGERVRVLMQFTDHAGLYLYHCHILEHEDLGMMRNYLVQA